MLAIGSDQIMGDIERDHGTERRSMLDERSLATVYRNSGDAAASQEAGSAAPQEKEERR